MRPAKADTGRANSAACERCPNADREGFCGSDPDCNPSDGRSPLSILPLVTAKGWRHSSPRAAGRLRIAASGIRQQSPVYPGGSDRLADFPHAFADRVDESPTGVLHQMPTVGDLYSVWKGPPRRYRVAAATISCNRGDLRLASQPGSSCRGLPIGQQRERAATLEVAEERAVTKVPLPGPVVDADDCPWREPRCAAAAHQSKQSVVAHSDIEPPRQSRRRPTAQRDRKAMNNFIEPARARSAGFDSEGFPS